MCDASAAVKPRSRVPRPRWGGLYGLVMVAGTALATTELILDPGALRFALECVFSLGLFAAMALWVRGNRAALDYQAWCPCAAEQVTVRVIASRQPRRPAVASDEPGAPVPARVAAAIELGEPAGHR